MKFKIILLTHLFYLASIVLLQAQWSKNPISNNPVMIWPGSNQSAPAIVSDNSKGAIIVWQDNRNSDADIYGMHIGEKGDLQWNSSGQPLASINGDQKAPSVVSTTDEFFYVAWQDLRSQASENEIYVQKFNFRGNSIWASDVLAHIGNNSPPFLLINNNRDLLTASYTSALFDDVISLQVIDQNAAKSFTPQLIANLNAKGRQPDVIPAVTAALEGGFMVAWADARNDTVLYVKGLQANGTDWPTGEFQVGESLVSGTMPAILSDGNEGAIVFWIQSSGSGQNQRIRARRLDKNGNSAWTEGIIDISAEPGQKKNLKIVSDGQNGAYIAWENSTTFGNKLYLQRVRNNGSVWLRDVALSTGSGTQKTPAIYKSSAKQVIVAWEDGRSATPDLYAQAVDSTGSLLWPAVGVAVSTASGTQKNPVIVDDGFGGAIVAWEDNRNNGVDTDIYAQRVSVTGELGEFRKVDISAPAATANWEIGSKQVIKWTATPQIDSIKIEISRDNGIQYQTLFELPNTAPNNGEVTINAVTGPASAQCKIRISAVEASFVLKESATFTISPAVGPVLDPDIITEASTGDSLIITSGATDISGVKEIKLGYKIGGTDSYTVVAMTDSGASIWGGLIPRKFVTLRGFHYYLTSSDNINNNSHTDTFFVAVNFDAGEQTKLIEKGSKQTSYRMISSPNELAETLADSILTNSGFGLYDTTSWRMYKYENAENVERDSANALTFDFAPGKSYWIISKVERTIDFGAGISVPANKPYTIKLNPGWNQIGNPFAFTVSWEGIMSTSGNPLISSLPYEYRGSYINLNTFEPYKGYFVYNFEDSVETLRIPPVEYIPDTTLNKENANERWTLQIESACKDARDDNNYLGIRDNASFEWDRLELPEPPPIGEFISVYFPQGSWQRFPMNYTTDYRQKIDAGQTWLFNVKTNISASEINLAFKGIESIPGELEVTLLDEKLNVKLDLRENNKYVFSSSSKEETKTLKIIIGNSVYTSETLAGIELIPTDFQLSQNFPNPFNPTTSIRYGLPKDENVTLRIYDLLGRQVTTLLYEKQQKAGYHVIIWNGKDKNGIPAASGLYVYQIKAGHFTQSKKMLLVK